MRLVELVAELERRATDAERMQATAPVACVLKTVLAELQTLDGVALSGHSPSPQADRLVTVAEAAARLNVSKRWLYAHAADFPFTKRLPGRRLRFSQAALTRYLERGRS